MYTHCYKPREELTPDVSNIYFDERCVICSIALISTVMTSQIILRVLRIMLYVLTVSKNRYWGKPNM